MSDFNLECGTVTPFTAKADKLSSGEILNMQRPTVKDRMHISFACDIKEMGDEFKLLIGQGYKTSNGCWLEITKETISAYTYFSYNTPPQHEIIEPTPHELEISEFLTVNIDKNTKNGSFIVLMTKGGMFKLEAPKIGANDGFVFASVEGGELEDCRMNWFCDGYADPIWIFGDSYLGFGYPARWPYYLYRDGYNKVFLSGYAGMNTQRGLLDFKLSLEKGTPVYAVWCLGMNNGDKSEEPEENWLKATEEFVAICKEKGIIPILSTIPNTPRIYNEPKNRWVRASGCRYIDFNRAVGAVNFDESIKDKKTYVNAKGETVYNITGYEWYEGMIYPDQVHPANNGAAALYSQVLVDFPEIMKRY
jgi:hypothetical protein